MQRPHPDVAEAHWIVMILQRKGPILRLIVEDHRMMHHDAVVHHGKHGGRHHLPVLDLGTLADNVVSLPLARLAGDIHQRRILVVERSGLTVGISVVFKGVEHLDLAPERGKDAAVAAALAAAFHLLRCGPLDVELRGAPLVLALERAGFGRADRAAVFDLPFRRRIIRSGIILGNLARPVGEVRAVEKHQGVTGRPSCFFLRGSSGRRHHRRSWALHVPGAIDAARSKGMFRRLGFRRRRWLRIRRKGKGRNEQD